MCLFYTYDSWWHPWAYQFIVAHMSFNPFVVPRREVQLITCTHHKSLTCILQCILPYWPLDFWAWIFALLSKGFSDQDSQPGRVIICKMSAILYDCPNDCFHVTLKVFITSTTVLSGPYELLRVSINWTQLNILSSPASPYCTSVYCYSAVLYIDLN